MKSIVIFIQAVESHPFLSHIPKLSWQVDCYDACFWLCSSQTSGASRTKRIRSWKSALNCPYLNTKLIWEHVFLIMFMVPLWRSTNRQTGNWCSVPPQSPEYSSSLNTDYIVVPCKHFAAASISAMVLSVFNTLRGAFGPLIVGNKP